MGTIHPGAACFSEEARRAIADGPLFDRKHDNAPTSRMYTRDGRACVVMALAAIDGVDWPALLDVNGDIDADPIVGLMDRNDRGDYRDRAALRRDLLGEE